MPRLRGYLYELEAAGCSHFIAANHNFAGPSPAVERDFMDRKPRLAIRRAGAPGRTLHRRAGTVAVLGLVCAVTAGCTSTVLAGRAASMLDDPDRVGGLPVNDGPSGVRSSAPAPTGTVRGSDGGAEDHLAVTAINDIQEFWSTAYPQLLRRRIHTRLGSHLL